MNRKPIVESNEYAEQIKGYRISAERLDEALQCVTDTLHRNPEFYPAIPYAGGVVIRRIKLAAFPGLVPLTIYFIVREKEIELLTAELIDDEV